MAFDFDPFNDLDRNFDGVIEEQDIKLYNLENGHGYQSVDLNHDMVFDKFQNDLNGDQQIDAYQVDLNQNSIVDHYEFNQMGTSFNFDVDGNGTVDEMDKALATTLLK